MKLVASLAGSYLEFDATNPRFKSFNATHWVLITTMSPGRAICTDSWCISTDITFPSRLVGPKVIIIPTFSSPVCTQPPKMVLTPPILYMHIRGRRRGYFSTGILGSSIFSSASRRGRPSIRPCWLTSWSNYLCPSPIWAQMLGQSQSSAGRTAHTPQLCYTISWSSWRWWHTSEFSNFNYQTRAECTTTTWYMLWIRDNYTNSRSVLLI